MILARLALPLSMLLSPVWASLGRNMGTHRGSLG